jgi:dienelactone hydrolase
VIAGFALLAILSTAAPSHPDSCVFVTLESGRVAGVDWVVRDGLTLHTRSVLTQSRVLDATIALRPDGTADHSSTVLAEAGKSPGTPLVRDLAGAIYWSDMIPSSIEQAVLRARTLDGAHVRVAAASLFSSSRGEAQVDRVDATDWVVRYHGKRIDVVTDSTGRMLSAALPEYGVRIERRARFAAARYAMWPPYAAPPDGAYGASEVTIPTHEGPVLAGTLTTPNGKGPFPAAVLITGLSPSERNGGEPPWMPLRDLADALTRAGIAVLRVDDRGIGASTGDHGPSTTFDEANDVRSEVAWLRAQPRIARRHVALVGYSEGGLIAPMVAASDSTIAAIVTLAGPGTSGADLARYQIEAAVTGDTTIATADREKEIAKQLADTLTARESSVLSIDPLDYARRVRCPALIVQGANDRHVPLRSAERLATAMRSNGNDHVTVRVFPGVSHSLLPDPGGLSSGWVYLPAFLTAPAILDAMSGWLAERLR